MATNKYQAVKTEIVNQLPSLIAGDPGHSSRHYERLFLASNPTLNTLGDQIRKGKFRKTVLEDKVNDVIIDLHHKLQVQKVGTKYYPLGFDLSTIPAKPKKAKAKAKKKAKAVVETVEETVVEPVVEPVEETVVAETTLEVEETQEIVETHITVEVDNPAVIEAHIDTETQELVENVGGLRDYRRPLDIVEDGYITTSSVQVSTTTLEPVVEVEVEQPVVEVENEPVEPVVVQEVDEPTPVVETPVEDTTEVEEDEVDNQPRYDLKELRKSASFDPLSITLKGVKGSYEVYRDTEARMVVLTQKGREDYVMIPVDVDLERLKGIDPRYAKFAQQAINDFENEGNHKVGCTRMCKALLSCCKMCQHTDDFGGLVEFCLDPNCPLQNIWGEGAVYVNPQDS